MNLPDTFAILPDTVMNLPDTFMILPDTFVTLAHFELFIPSQTTRTKKILTQIG